MCDRCAELEEENRYLRRELGMMADEAEVHAIRCGCRVHPGVARMLSCLYRANGRPVKTSSLLAGVPGKDRAADDERGENNVRVWVMRARAALGADAIDVAYGIGYRLTPEGMAKIADVLK